MNKVLSVIIALLMATQASAGTALVLFSESGLTLIYPAADHAGDTDPLPYDLAICDGDFENCLEFMAKNGNKKVMTYQSGYCEITIEESKQKDKDIETVKILKGAESCKLKTGSELQSIARDFIFDYNR